MAPVPTKIYLNNVFSIHNIDQASVLEIFLNFSLIAYEPYDVKLPLSTSSELDGYTRLVCVILILLII